MLFSLVIFGLCAVFYGAAVVVFALGLYLQGPLGWLMFLVGGWALFNSGVYTLLVETARLDMPPANRKPGKTPVRKTRGRWCDELAPAAWRRLVSARNAAAVWYDITYMPQLHETLRSALEYAMLAVAAVADLAIFCVAYLYVLGGPVLVARKADGILSWVQGAVFLVVGLYFLATWLVRRYPDRKDIANAEALKTAGEAAQAAVLALGTWDSLGVELGRICGPDRRQPAGGVKGAAAWAVGLTGKLFGGAMLGKSLAAGIYAGDFLLVLGVVFTYSLLQFSRILHARWQARHPEEYSPCEFVPLLALLDTLRKTGHIDGE